MIAWVIGTAYDTGTLEHRLVFELVDYLNGKVIPLLL
jgi:hypothetical protein